MWCGAVFRHLRAHERCQHCVGSHRVPINDWLTIHLSISWSLVYAVTWSYPDQSQPIAPVPHASPRQSIPCYRTNDYYQFKQRFYSVLGISRAKYIPQHLVSKSDRPRCIPTYQIDFKSIVESTSNWVPLNKILCEGVDWGAKCVKYWHQIPSISWRWWTSNLRWWGYHIQHTKFQTDTGG